MRRSKFAEEAHNNKLSDMVLERILAKEKCFKMLKQGGFDSVKNVSLTRNEY